MKDKYSVAFSRAELRRSSFAISSTVVKKGLVSIVPKGDIVIFIYNNEGDRDAVYQECKTVKFLAKYSGPLQ